MKWKKQSTGHWKVATDTSTRRTCTATKKQSAKSSNSGLMRAKSSVKSSLSRPKYTINVLQIIHLLIPVLYKLPFIGNHPSKVGHFLELSLKNLQLDYVNLYLIHFPVGLIGKDDNDLCPKDDSGGLVLNPNTDLVKIWLVLPFFYINTLAISYYQVDVSYTGNGGTNQKWQDKGDRGIEFQCPANGEDHTIVPLQACQPANRSSRLFPAKRVA